MGRERKRRVAGKKEEGEKEKWSISLLTAQKGGGEGGGEGGILSFFWHRRKGGAIGAAEREKKGRKGKTLFLSAREKNLIPSKHKAPIVREGEGKGENPGKEGKKEGSTRPLSFEEKDGQRGLGTHGMEGRGGLPPFLVRRGGKKKKKKKMYALILLPASGVFERVFKGEREEEGGFYLKKRDLHLSIRKKKRYLSAEGKRKKGALQGRDFIRLVKGKWNRHREGEGKGGGGSLPSPSRELGGGEERRMGLRTDRRDTLILFSKGGEEKEEGEPFLNILGQGGGRREEKEPCTFFSVAREKDVQVITRKRKEKGAPYR